MVSGSEATRNHLYEASTKDILTNLKQIYMICSRFLASGNFNSNFVVSLGLLIGGWVNLKVFDWPFLIEA